jgi:hypothetical protein
MKSSGSKSSEGKKEGGILGKMKKLFVKDKPSGGMEKDDIHIKKEEDTKKDHKKEPEKEKKKMIKVAK